MTGTGWQIQLRRRDFPAADWEPVSFALATELAPDAFTRPYHYSTLEAAKKALRNFLGVENGPVNTLVRMATGLERTIELFEVRFVQIGAIVSFDEAFAQTGTKSKKVLRKQKSGT